MQEPRSQVSTTPDANLQDQDPSNLNMALGHHGPRMACMIRRYFGHTCVRNDVPGFQHILCHLFLARRCDFRSCGEELVEKSPHPRATDLKGVRRSFTEQDLGVKIQKRYLPSEQVSKASKHSNRLREALSCFRYFPPKNLEALRRNTGCFCNFADCGPFQGAPVSGLNKRLGR